MKPERVDHCLHIVDDYYIPWFNYILHQLNPKSACTLMGLCKEAGQEFLAPNKAPITLLLSEVDPQPEVQQQPNNRK